MNIKKSRLIEIIKEEMGKLSPTPDKNVEEGFLDLFKKTPGGAQPLALGSAVESFERFQKDMNRLIDDNEHLKKEKLAFEDKYKKVKKELDRLARDCGAEATDTDTDTDKGDETAYSDLPEPGRPY